MIRKIIQIDQEKCNGCRACVDACHEGAIVMVSGKAQLMRDDYCDGLGDCLPNCPTGAITFVEREAADYDEEAVKKNMAAQGRVYKGRCPGSEAHAVTPEAAKESRQGDSSQLRQWPVQLKLVPPHAPYFNGARLLIAADCTAYAYARFHDDFIKGHITLIGCPKLDDIDYSEKLTEIIRQNAIQDVTVVRMEVPCCRGLEMAVKKALDQSGKSLDLQVKVISPDGRITA
ncbi:4Fe-4S binding protein [Megasphaera sp.]|uniref:4Fe-4S binding protein n=1 Tax=Megasphaera TaxID=906 RepID=UPI001DF49A29|nr:4Fe-4S binding protein [Megasphaera sp.]MBS6790569.1 4Fe-4S binding protein [Megasphaera sp.]